MNSLKIPEGGVTLKGSPDEGSDPLPQQAFTISLNDSVIEGMIKCVQNGGDIQLALGADPTFRYGTKSHRISSPPDDHPCDLYLTQPYNTLREGVQIPSMPLFRNPKLNRPPSKARDPVVKAAPPKTKGSKNTSSLSSLDSDVEALRNGMAAEKAKQESTVLLSGPLPANKKAASKMKNKLSTWGTTRSLSTSPALKPVTSPSPDPLADPAKRAKQQRATLVHELAVREQTTEHLRKKWEGKPEEFDSVLKKVADFSSESKTWAMRKAYWKELDVWNYDYSSSDREQSIKNAVKQYDKNRLSASEPEWERLNPKEDRGKGICLSKLQKSLAMGPAAPAPKIKLQKADDSSTSTSRDKDDGDGGLSDKPKAGGESMSRSASNPLPKAKKISGSEAQAKRLLNPKPRATSQKPSPTKAKPAPPKVQSNGGRGALSQEFIENSDSSDDESAPLAKTTAAKPKPAAKPIEKPKKRLEKAAEKSLSKPKPVTRDPLPKPVAKPAAKAPPKRRADDDDSSSSSGTPLSQRMKLKQPLPSQPSAKKRALDSRQGPREPPPSSLSRNKNTSPTKSSPLASSPPTNASDITDDEPRVSKKRKADMNQKAPPAKRLAADGNVPEDLLSQAQKFKTFYSMYETLHYEISGLDNPPKDKLADLREMRERLAHMKEQIYKKYRG